MHYVCVENSKVVSILSYKPAVPSSVKVYSISQREFDLIAEGTHYFHIESGKIAKHSANVLAIKDAEKENIQYREFLNSTDWKVLRHIRERALGLPTSLTEEQYLKLEQDRQSAAAKIVK